MEQYRKLETVEFIYDSSEEKEAHKKEMEAQGFEDSGQIKFNINQNLNNPVYVFYGKYYKYS